MSESSSNLDRLPTRKVITAGAIALVALVFIFQNTRSARLDFLFWSISMPGWVWLIALFAAGVAVGSAFPWLRRRSARSS